MKFHSWKFYHRYNETTCSQVYAVQCTTCGVKKVTSLTNEYLMGLGEERAKAVIMNVLETATVGIEESYSSDCTVTANLLKVKQVIES